MGVKLDFTIAGCAKSGTTALAALLDSHPGVYMSKIKESNYFVHGFESVEAVRTANGQLAHTHGSTINHIDCEDRFGELFSGAEEGQLLGDASPLYLATATAPARLDTHNPGIRVVLILRNPSDVAWANFVHHVRDRTESVGIDNFEEFIRESRYYDPDLHVFARHLSIPEYARLLPNWIQRFHPERLHIEIHEEFRVNPIACQDRITNFLGIRKQHCEVASLPVNQSRLPRSELLHSMVLQDSTLKRMVRTIVPIKTRRRLRLQVERMNAGTRPVMPNHIRSHLDDRYAIDRDYVAHLLNRPIPSWDKRVTST